MLRGIIPIVITPFDSSGRIDEESLRRVVRFELEGGAHGIGVGGFASEAYKLADWERIRCAEVVAYEVANRVPLIIGMAPGSSEAAIEQAYVYANLRPAALMVLPPNVMQLDEAALVEFYIALGAAAEVPIMVQQSPQIQAYAHCQISTEGLAAIARSAPNVRCFKIEGPGSARRIHALRQRVGDEVTLFGGVGGVTLREELEAGANGLLPGVGFNEGFVRAWTAWETSNTPDVDAELLRMQPVVDGVSSYGHEYSLHARKYLLRRAGIIADDLVRRPSVRPDYHALDALGNLVDQMGLRIGRQS